MRSIYGYVADDLGWPLPPPAQTTQIFAFFVAFRIFVVGQRSDFQFDTQVSSS